MTGLSSHDAHDDAVQDRAGEGGPDAKRHRLPHPRKAREDLLTDRDEERRRKESDKKRRIQEEYQHDLLIQQRKEEARRQTQKAEQRLQRLTNLLRATLLREIEPLSFEQMKTEPAAPPLDLGADANPTPRPVWEEYAPRTPRGPARLLRGGAASTRHQQARADAEEAFARAVARHAQSENDRRERVEALRERYQRTHGEEIRHAEEHNTAVDRFQAGVIERDPRAVSDYFRRVLDALPDPHGLPHEARTAYVPESALLVVNAKVPGMGIIPAERECRYNEAEDVIEATRSWTPEQVRHHYEELLARLALRALHQLFFSDPDDLVQTIVFNGYVDAAETATGLNVRPCLITLRAGRARFHHLKLDRVNPLTCVRKQFGAVLSPHPEGLAEVTPYLDFALADPARLPSQRSATDEATSGGTGNGGTDLLQLPTEEFGQLIHQLLVRMGLEVGQVRPTGDGLDCRAGDPTPGEGGTWILHVVRSTQVLTASAVRTLAAAVHQEHAARGLLITTSGFGAGCFDFANGKPLQLYDGTVLLALCRRHNIPADLPAAKMRADRPGGHARNPLARLRAPHAGEPDRLPEGG